MPAPEPRPEPWDEYLRDIGVTSPIRPPSPSEKAREPDKTRAALAKDSGVEKTKSAALEALRREIGDCTRCKLYSHRTHIVFGVGNPNAELMFAGEAPGRDEDAQGIPFVGRAGQLLTRMIEAMGYRREDVYIANVLKCRPPENRNPEPDEVKTCKPFLKRQVEIVHPRAIVGLGSFAVQTLLNSEEKISRLRGNFRDFQGIPLMPTYHPAFLLRNPEMKKPVWEDLKKVMAFLKGGSGG